MLELGGKKLPQGKCLVIGGGGGCSDGETSLFIRRDHPIVNLRDLQANHEEQTIIRPFYKKGTEIRNPWMTSHQVES